MWLRAISQSLFQMKHAGLGSGPGPRAPCRESGLGSTLCGLARQTPPGSHLGGASCLPEQMQGAF